MWPSGSGQRSHKTVEMAAKVMGMPVVKKRSARGGMGVNFRAGCQGRIRSRD